MVVKTAAIAAAIVGSLVAVGAGAYYYVSQLIEVDFKPFQLSEAKENQSDKFGFKFESCAQKLFYGVEKIEVTDGNDGSGSKTVDAQDEIDVRIACFAADAVYQKQESTNQNQKKNMISAKFELAAINEKVDEGVVIWTAFSNMHKETSRPYLTTRVAYLERTNGQWRIKGGFEFQHSEISDPDKEIALKDIFSKDLKFNKLCKINNGQDACGELKEDDLDRDVAVWWWSNKTSSEERVLDEFEIFNDNKKAVFFGTELSTTNKDKATLKKIYDTTDKKWKSGYTLSWGNDVKSPIKKDSKGLWWNSLQQQKLSSK